MNNETNKNTGTEQKQETGEKTFTQEEVNRIVSDRLTRERETRKTELDEREKTLKQRELAVIAREKLDAAGLNKELCNVLRYDDEAELDQAIEQLKTIRGFAGKVEEKQKRVIENRLPTGSGDIEPKDPIREAFKYKA